MPAPKGMRVVPVAVSETDAVHIYSDDGHIWLQLRRDVPTAKKITTTSFKATLTLTPEQATAVANELLTLAKQKSPAGNPAKLVKGPAQVTKPTTHSASGARKPMPYPKEPPSHPVSK